jgi:hypothetical protein
MPLRSPYDLRGWRPDHPEPAAGARRTLRVLAFLQYRQLPVPVQTVPFSGPAEIEKLSLRTLSDPSDIVWFDPAQLVSLL